MYTIQREIGKLDGIKVGLVGDLAYGRTVRSLAYLLAQYEDVKIYFVSPEVVKMKVYILCFTISPVSVWSVMLLWMKQHGHNEFIQWNNRKSDASIKLFLSFWLIKLGAYFRYEVLIFHLLFQNDIKDHLTSSGVEWEECSDLMEVASTCDVVYQTRIQRERFGERVDLYEEARGKYIVDRDVLGVMQKHAVVMHPLPRLDDVLYDSCLLLSCS